MWLWPRRAKASLLSEALVASRVDARLSGAEWVLTKIEANAAQMAAEHADRIRAIAAAQSYTERVASVGSAAANPALERIIISETAQAFNVGIVEQAKAAAEETGLELEKVWRAEGDACPSCAALDGSSVPLHEDFPDGEPGSIHPNCRCVTDIRRKQ